MKNKTRKKMDRHLLFYIVMMAWPVAQFCVFYLGVNFRSFLYAFQEIDVARDTIVYTIDTIKQVFAEMISSPQMLVLWKNSLLNWGLSLVISLPLGLLFAYYIWKKMSGHNLFRVLLFMPSIISGLVLVTIYRFFVERAIPEYSFNIFGKTILGLLENPDTRYGAVFFFNIWTGFGISTLMYSDSMERIPVEITEAAQLDGYRGFKEFIYVTVPMCFSTISTFLIVGITGIFVNQFAVFSFFDSTAPEGIQNWGYWLYSRTLVAAESDYPELSAYGLLLSCIAIPLTFLVKWVLEKKGPSED